MTKVKGWKAIPLLLKIIFILSVLWIIGSVMQLSLRYKTGLPFFGVFVHGIAASLIVFVLDILGPVLFLFALWNRKAWGVLVAVLYLGIFILNSIVAFFTVGDQLGFMPIFIPLLVNSIFLSIIYYKKSYFK